MSLLHYMLIISDGFIYAVNGMTFKNIQIRGFTIDHINRNVIEFWNPESSVSIIFHIFFFNKKNPLHY